MKWLQDSHGKTGRMALLSFSYFYYRIYKASFQRHINSTCWYFLCQNLIRSFCQKFKTNYSNLIAPLYYFSYLVKTSIKIFNHFLFHLPLFKEVVSFIIYHNECWEILNLYFPYCFHTYNIKKYLVWNSYYYFT